MSKKKRFNILPNPIDTINTAANAAQNATDIAS